MDLDPLPIRLGNLGSWLRRTREVDDELSARRARPLTAKRLLLRLVPAVRSPLFVLGAPRSGTSFLGDALGALPEFTYHYEPPITKAAVRYVHDGLWSEARCRLFYRLVYHWLAGRRFENDLRFAEKTPQNCFVIGFLARAFPDARFVHIVRDGRDAALSLSKKGWLAERSRDSGRRESGGYRMGPFPRFWVEPERREEFERVSDLRRCAWAWRRHTEAALAGGAKLPPARWLEVRYEELVAEPGAHAERLSEFLGIGAPASRAALADALAQARRDSVGSWRRELSAAALAEVEAEALPLLELLGYRAGAREGEG